MGWNCKMKFIKEFLSFIVPAGDGNSVQMAVFLAGLALATALIAPPFLDKAAKTYADNRAFGIDTVITGSIEKSERKTIRRSVLDGDQEVCTTGNGETC